MSELPGNPHYESADSLANHAHGLDELDANGLSGLANAEATLALAYEQRTANLIAVLNMSPVDMTDWPKQAAKNFFELNRTITQRLGMRNGDTQ